MPSERPLSELLPDVEGAYLQSGSAETLVSGVSHDSRTLAPGEIFVAIPGLEYDGTTFIQAALTRGASAIVTEIVTRSRGEAPRIETNELPLSPGGGRGVGPPTIKVPSARRALADLSAAFYNHPSKSLHVVGITGTDGKTTTAHLLSAILEASGKHPGWMTTVNTRIRGVTHPNAADHTTPEAPIIQRTLADMRDAGVDVAILETSSHALALERVRGVAYEVGIFTNLSPEHINFHGSFKAYHDAKAHLFELLPPHGLAVLNADDPTSASLAALSRAPIRTYGFDSADVVATDLRLTADGTTFLLRDGSTQVNVRTHLVGRFNVANWLAAYTAATHFGATAADLVRAAACQPPVPGRMNLVQAGQPFAVVVDFAHTPQALARALDTVRTLVTGRVLLVFGLAGGRDFHNRPVMGQLAARHADVVVVSQDDPGFEDPREIASQVADAARAAGAQDLSIELDRRAAIGKVLELAQPGDVVLLAGKGHEERMVVRGQKLPWNDTRVAREELQRLGWTQPDVP